MKLEDDDEENRRSRFMMQSQSIDGIVVAQDNKNGDDHKSLEMSSHNIKQKGLEIIEESSEPKNSCSCCNLLNKYSYFMLYCWKHKQTIILH